MTNFIFKSQGTYKKLCQQLVIIQSELRAQRQDNIQIMFLLNKLLTNKKLQSQVDEFFEPDDQIEPEPAQEQGLGLIVSKGQQSGSPKVSSISRTPKRFWFGPAYEGFKQASRTYGFYKDIKSYLPETYLEKYKYKPGKRITGALQKTKGFLSAYNKQYKKRRRPYCEYGNWSSKSFTCKSSKHTTFN